jgi:hypothetical protein
MAMAKVWNDNGLPFTQKFKGTVFTIPAGGFIEMEYEEAVSFKSYPFPMKFDGMGQQTQDSYKMIRVDGKPDTGNQVVAYKCHADGSLHANPEALNAYVQENHAHKMVTPEEKIKKTAKA